MRYVEKLWAKTGPQEGSQQDMILLLRQQMSDESAAIKRVWPDNPNAGPPKVIRTLRNIEYHYITEREVDVYPTREGYYVVAPAFMDDKLRGKPEKFNERWERVGQGLPMNPEKPPVKKKAHVSSELTANLNDRPSGD